MRESSYDAANTFATSPYESPGAAEWCAGAVVPCGAHVEREVHAGQFRAVVHAQQHLTVDPRLATAIRGHAVRPLAGRSVHALPASPGCEQPPTAGAGGRRTRRNVECIACLCTIRIPGCPDWRDGDGEILRNAQRCGRGVERRFAHGARLDQPFASAGDDDFTTGRLAASRFAASRRDASWCDASFRERHVAAFRSRRRTRGGARNALPLVCFATVRHLVRSRALPIFSRIVSTLDRQTQVITRRYAIHRGRTRLTSDDTRRSTAVAHRPFSEKL